MHKVFTLPAFSIFLALYACGGGGESKGGNRPDITYFEPEAYVAEEQFVGTIVIKRNQNYLLRKGYGYANSAEALPNDIDTRYRIGSLTKAFTALAVVQLKNASLINGYDDLLSDYIPDYPRGDEITIRHLLQHRSGIPDYVESANLSNTYTPVQLVELFENKSLNFQPGQRFEYSNSNYILLGYLVEILAGTSYESYMSNNVWAPLGLSSTEYGASSISGIGYAKGYRDTSQTQLAGVLDMSIPYSAGAISSNVSDLEVWAESFADSTLVSSADLEDIFRTSGYGFGWNTVSIEGRKVFTHGGSINGFSSIIIIFPESEGVIVALSNVEGQQEKIRRIVNTVVINEF